MYIVKAEISDNFLLLQISEPRIKSEALFIFLTYHSLQKIDHSLHWEK